MFWPNRDYSMLFFTRMSISTFIGLVTSSYIELRLNAREKSFFANHPGMSAVTVSLGGWLFVRLVDQLLNFNLKQYFSPSQKHSSVVNSIVTRDRLFLVQSHRMFTTSLDVTLTET